MPLRALLVALIFILYAAAADVPATRDVRSAAEAVTRDQGVQLQLPTDSGVPEKSAQARSRGPFLSASGPFSIANPAAVLNLLGWALIAALVVAIIAFLAVWFREPLESRLPPVSPGGVVLDPPRPPVDPRDLLARADQLASAGQYSEAMHCVLLAAVAILGRNKPRKTADSLTSWELLRDAPLAPPQICALRDVVIRAERAWFGKRPAGLEDYKQARGSFETFASHATESA